MFFLGVTYPDCDVFPPENSGALSGHGYLVTPLGMLCELSALNPPENPLIFHLGAEQDALAVHGKQPVFRCSDFEKP